MTPRAILGPGDLPMLVRAERVPLSLTRQSIERLVELAVLHLEALDEMTADTRNDARSAEHPATVRELADLERCTPGAIASRVKRARAAGALQTDVLAGLRAAVARLEALERELAR
jgi:hypothetical protein